MSSIYGAKTAEGKERQSAGRRKYSTDRTSIHGDTYRLTNGLVVTSVSLFKLAASKGAAVTIATVARRLASGMRDFDQLIAAPDQKLSAQGAKGRAGKIAKRAADTEFLAALAAVNARRAAR